MGPLDLVQGVISSALSTITPAMGEALIWMLFCNLAVVHTIKVLFRRTVRQPTQTHIYLLTVAVSVLAAWTLWPAAASVPSLIPGLVMGPITNALFWGASAPLKRFMPRTWATVNFERRKNPSDAPLPQDVPHNRRIR